ncbi:DNA replication/repair protein RecF [Granulosicoccaceae sp. 1_MG-2023]|nr:DNA replication/repair protein RecF [Granulosicoccaceae sp. 1_MG-2023]
MYFSHIEIRSLRNITQSTLDCVPAINFIFGANGAGKTAILEAIYLLGSGRSFRTHYAKELIKDSADELIVRARFSKEGGTEHQAAVLRNRRGDIRIRLDHEDLRSTGELARLIPLMVIHPGMHELILGGPGQRRRFLDWGLFHVEQGFFAVWKNYNHALEQRNALLKKGGQDSSIQAWTDALTEYGDRLTAQRQGFVESLCERMRYWCEFFNVGGEVSVEYRRGWDKQHSLAEALAHSLPQCVRYRTTTVGPHRADLKILLEGTPAKSRASRGQMKMLIYAMVFAQLDLHRELTGEHACLLCDDPVAELDVNHQTRLVEAIRQTGVQAFLTGVEFPHLPTDPRDARFHLEEGECISDGPPIASK